MYSGLPVGRAMRFGPTAAICFACMPPVRLASGEPRFNPLCFQPFGGFADGELSSSGRAALPQSPGVGFELKTELFALFKSLFEL